MKTSQIARGIVGALSLAGVIGAVGCAGYDGAEGAAGEGEIGSTSQAIALSLAAPSFDALYPASLKLDAAKLLIAGGYDNAGNASAVIQKFDPSVAGSPPGQWAAPAGAVTTLPTALGEPQIIKIPTVNGKFLISGGRSGLGVNTFRNQAYIFDETGDTVITPSNNMSAARVNHVMVPCGTGARVLAIGGRSAAGTVQNTLDVFTYNAATPTSSAWAALGASGGGALTLNTARAYHGAVALDATHILVFGGETAAGAALNAVELITVDNNCANATKTNKGNLPAAFSQFAFAKGPSTSRSVILAGGTTNGSAAVNSTLLYDNPTSDTWTTLASTLTTGAVLPMISAVSANVFEIVGGTDAVIDSVGGLGNSLTQVRDIDLSAGTPAWTSTSVPQLMTARAGQGQAFINATVKVLASQGATFAAGVPTYLRTIE